MNHGTLLGEKVACKGEIGIGALSRCVRRTNSNCCDVGNLKAVYRAVWRAEAAHCQTVNWNNRQNLGLMISFMTLLSLSDECLTDFNQ